MNFEEALTFPTGNPGHYTTCGIRYVTITHEGPKEAGDGCDLGASDYESAFQLLKAEIERYLAERKAIAIEWRKLPEVCDLRGPDGQIVFTGRCRLAVTQRATDEYIAGFGLAPVVPVMNKPGDVIYCSYNFQSNKIPASVVGARHVALAEVLASVVTFLINGRVEMIGWEKEPFSQRRFDFSTGEHFFIARARIEVRTLPDAEDGASA